MYFLIFRQLHCYLRKIIVVLLYNHIYHCNKRLNMYRKKYMEIYIGYYISNMKICMNSYEIFAKYFIVSGILQYFNILQNTK